MNRPRMKVSAVAGVFAAIAAVGITAGCGPAQSAGTSATPSASAPASSHPATPAAAPSTASPSPSRTTVSIPPAVAPSPAYTPPAYTPPTAPAAPRSAPAAACYPLTNGGNCYEPGEYCRDSDHGASGVAGDGESISCEDNNGWRWEPA